MRRPPSPLHRGWRAAQVMDAKMGEKGVSAEKVKEFQKVKAQADAYSKEEIDAVRLPCAHQRPCAHHPLPARRPCPGRALQALALGPAGLQAVQHQVARDGQRPRRRAGLQPHVLEPDRPGARRHPTRPATPPPAPSRQRPQCAVSLAQPRGVMMLESICLSAGAARGIW